MLKLEIILILYSRFKANKIIRTFYDKDNSFVGHAKKEADMYSIDRNISRNDFFNFLKER